MTETIYQISEQNLLKYILIIGGMLFVANTLGSLLFLIVITRSIKMSMFTAYTTAINGLLGKLTDATTEIANLKAELATKNSALDTIHTTLADLQASSAPSADDLAALNAANILLNPPVPAAQPDPSTQPSQPLGTEVSQ